MNFDIAGLGTIVMDHQIVLESYPTADSKHEIRADRLQVGGPVPTALAVMAKFGKRTTFLGNWGNDPFGEMIEEDLGREQIDFSGSVRRSSIRTGFAHVWIDSSSGSRTIVCSRPAEPLTEQELDSTLLSNCGGVYLDGWPEEAAREAAQLVKNHQGLVFLDSGSPKPGMDRLIPLVDVLNCPRRFLEQFFGSDDILAGGRKLVSMGPRMVTVTDGERGATMFTSTDTLHQPAFPVQVVDTTGAGDVFSGALAYAILEKQSPLRALRFAAATAALKCTQLGNREALPPLDAVLRLLED